MDRIKKHLKENKDRYITGVIVGVGVAGFTVAIMRVVDSQSISVTIGDAASRTIGVAGNRIVMDNVSFISSNRQGPPSWVIRCLETDEVFTSQRKAALAMDLAQDHLSQHLNGTRDHVGGKTFERLCLAG